MNSGMKTVMYPVKDISAAKMLYSSLFGVDPYMDKPYYVGFNVGGGKLIATVKDGDGNVIGVLPEPAGDRG